MVLWIFPELLRELCLFSPKENTIMAKERNFLSEFSLVNTDFSSVRNMPDIAIVNDFFGMARNVGPYRENFVRKGQPYRLPEGRILWVTEGSADIELTLEEYHFEKGDILLFAPETIMELKSCSDDYNMMGIMFKENIPVSENIILHASETDWNETLGLANVLWDIAHRMPFRRETVDYLLSAIISDIQTLYHIKQESAPVQRVIRKEQLFSRFKNLVNEHCSRHRTISFYADKLALTPHYLSTLIARISGHSVMYWVNRATLIQAKVLLKNKDMLVGEVADRLNFPSQSAFGTFFKRETGMTPGEYQKTD